MRISDWSSDVCSSDLGDIYVLDRQTGEPLFPVEERPVPGGGVEPEQRARTQPFSTYATLRKPDLTERDMWGLTPLDQLACRIRSEEHTSELQSLMRTSDASFCFQK